MKRFLILWVVACLAVIIIPRAIDKFTPKVIVKEVPIIKEVVKEVIKEVPVFKGEKIVKKEKIIYQPLQESIFSVNKISDDEYTIRIVSSGWNGAVELFVVGDVVHFKRKSNPIYNSVTSNTVGWQ